MDLYKLKILIGIILFTELIFCQKNNIYAELGGAGYTKTFNYERMLTSNIIARLGYGFEKEEGTNNYSDNEFIKFYPLGAAYLFGAGENRFEIGGGMTFLDGTLEMHGEKVEENQSTVYIGSGYRYYLTDGLLFGVKGYYLTLGKFSAPWLGISLGWKF